MMMMMEKFLISDGVCVYVKAKPLAFFFPSTKDALIGNSERSSEVFFSFLFFTREKKGTSSVNSFEKLANSQVSSLDAWTSQHV